MRYRRVWKSLIALAASAILAGLAVSQETAKDGYAGSQACVSCHAEAHAAWLSSKHAAKPSYSDPAWATDCAGCHTPGTAAGESAAGCESCHGPGSSHASTGDKDRIVSRKDADICGQCHLGNGPEAQGKIMSDGTKWVVGFKPGMKLSEVKGVLKTPVNPDRIPPETGPQHKRTFNMWEASGHSRTLERVAQSENKSADCYGCHSDEGFKARMQGKKVDLTQKDSFSPVTCVTCHEPHNSKNPAQLVMDAEKLCTSCHRQRSVLEGKGAKGIEDTRSFHSGVECVSCHMSEGNHLMKVIRPDDPELSEKRIDTCTACHKDNNREARAEQIQEWQRWYRKAMDPVQADLKAIETALKQNPDILNAELKAKLNDVKANIAIIISDRSEGAHNLDFALEIMSLAAADLKEIQAAMK